jgi:hypothetical protein
MKHPRPLESIPDEELLRRLAELLQQSRRVEADLVAHIGEVEGRRLYAREACPSMFVYCTEVLHLSEAEAYLRIAVARASRKHPVLLTLLEEGRLHLTGIALLAPHLTQENADALLKRAAYRSKRQVLELIAEIAPRPDVPAVMRKVPQRGKTQPPAPSSSLEGSPSSVELFPDGVTVPTGCREQSSGTGGKAVASREPLPPRTGGLLFPDGVGSPVSAPSRITVAATVPTAVVEPLSPARYKVQFTASAELRDKPERLRALMRPQVPDGDLAAIIEQAVTEKLERLEARQFAKTSAPRKSLSKTDTSSSSRHVPAAVRRAVRERDGNRCRYVDAQGRRCPERHRLEYHHRHPYGLGGDHDPRNICLLCHGHNMYLASHDYGQAAMARYQRSSNSHSEAAVLYATGSMITRESGNLRSTSPKEGGPRMPAEVRP